MVRLELDSLNSYVNSARRVADARLKGFRGPMEVAAAAEDLNAYPGLETLSAPRTVRVLEEEEGDLDAEGRAAVLAGRVFWEHAAAGEATRLSLGPKFFLTPDFLLKEYQRAGLGPALPRRELLPLELGRRHLKQLVYEIRELALEAGEDPQKVLNRQKTLFIASAEAMEAVQKQVLQDLYGLWPLPNIWFMTQASFYGLNKRGEKWDYDPVSPKRLHNHGAMLMQKAMDGQIYRFNAAGELQRLSREEHLGELAAFDNLVSYNIEDLDYLTRALDFAALGLAARAKDEGYGFLMEVLSNNPERPIKGGCCAFDPALKRDVMIESFRLKGYRPEDIKFLNKNINHNLGPAQIYPILQEKGLFMPVSVKDGFLYFQPVQGDLNFILPTAFFRRQKMRPINCLKALGDIPAALEAMEAQDLQPGFPRFAESPARG
ncbi:MAG: hypothetical protein LBO66_08495 [Deltaproteobacteria bacterium]|nr:hypothetical protein [Deltaproteobacteria bacterium]